MRKYEDMTKAQGGGDQRWKRGRWGGGGKKESGWEKRRNDRQAIRAKDPVDGWILKVKGFVYFDSGH